MQDFFHASTEIQGCQKHHFNGRNPFHATKCNLFLNVMVLETVKWHAHQKQTKRKQKKSAKRNKVLTRPKSPRQQSFPSWDVHSIDANCVS